MPLADDQNMIPALTPTRSDQAFSVWVLPRRPRRYGSVTNPHRSNSALKGLPVGTIIVAHELGGRRVPRECLCHLLSRPLRRRVAGHRKPQQLPPSMADNKKGKQPLEGQGWNHAQIDRRNCVRMVAQECPPALRWRSTAPVRQTHMYR